MGSSVIQSYRDLKVWQQAMDLAEECYKLTRQFPRDELYGMTSQVRRSAASVAANIAEGHGRNSRGEYIQFLRVAQGSLKELETHLILAARVGLSSDGLIAQVLGESEGLGKMLRALIRSLKRGKG
ncbi:MAG: four helix bundle protein [Acidobacteriota bacterium]